MPNVGNVRLYGLESVKSVEDYLSKRGYENPDAFINRFDLVDIIQVVPAVERMLDANNNIRNPSGLLWRMLEARERRQMNGYRSPTR